FPMDGFWREEDGTYQTFAARYQQAFNRMPSRNSLYSYDVTKALLNVIAGGARERQEIATAFATLKNFRGVHSTISFTEKRVNGVVAILQYRNRVISRLGEMDVATGRFSADQD
ncbi:MAG: hypothetical protein ACRDGA_01230, partial [Bacteroidota bacterium]